MAGDILHNVRNSVNDWIAYHNILTEFPAELDNVPHVTFPVRVSSRKQATHGFSLDWQEHTLIEAIKRFNVPSVTLVNEGAADGRKVDRPALLEAVKIARERGGPIIGWFADRIVRPWPMRQDQRDKLAAYGVPFVSMLSLSTPDKLLKSKRIELSFAEKRKRGELCGRPFDANQQALDFCLSRLGQSYRSLAKQLNATAIRRLTGATWTHKQVSRILTPFPYSELLGGGTKGSSRYMDTLDTLNQNHIDSECVRSVSLECKGDLSAASLLDALYALGS